MHSIRIYPMTIQQVNEIRKQSVENGNGTLDSFFDYPLSEINILTDEDHQMLYALATENGETRLWELPCDWEEYAGEMYLQTIANRELNE